MLGDLLSQPGIVFTDHGLPVLNINFMRVVAEKAHFDERETLVGD